MTLHVGQRVLWFAGGGVVRPGLLDRISPEGIHYRVKLDQPFTDRAGVLWTHRYAYGPELKATSDPVR